MTVPRRHEVLDDVPQVCKCRRLEEYVLSSGSGPQILIPVEHLSNTRREATTSTHTCPQCRKVTTPRCRSYQMNLWDLDEPDLESVGWRELTEHYSNGDVDLVYGTIRRDAAET